MVIYFTILSLKNHLRGLANSFKVPRSKDSKLMYRSKVNVKVKVKTMVKDKVQIKVKVNAR